MISNRVFLILTLLSFTLAGNCDITSTDHLLDSPQDKKELSQKAEKYYSLAEKYYVSKPDSCLLYTLAYLNIARELGDKRKLADALYWASDIYFYYNLDSALYYGDQYFNLANELQDSSWIAYAYYTKGSIYCEKGRFDKSLSSLRTALQYFENLKDTSLISALHNDIGYTLTYGSSQVEGITHFLKSLELAEKTNDTSLIADVSTNLAYYFATTDDLENAYKYFERSLIKTNELGDSLNSLIAYADMANTFLAMGKPEDAKAYIDTAQNFKPAMLSPYDKATVFSIFADFHLESGDPERAELYLLELGTLLNKHKYPLQIAYYQRQVGLQYYQQENYQKALSYFNSSITLYNSMNAVEGMVELYQYKAECYAKLSDFKNAYTFSHLSDSVRKSFHYSEISQLLAEREKEIELSRQIERNQILNKLEALEMKSKLTNVFIVSILLIISFTIAIYSALRLKRKNLILEKLNERNLQQQTKLEENLKVLNENKLQLTASNVTKDRLFSIIGHDLRGPLSAISSLSDIYLQDDKNFANKEIQPVFEGLKSAADYGFNILENLLQWSLSNTGDLVANPELIEPVKLLNDVISGIRHLIEQKELKLKMNFAEECIVFADPNMVSTIIRNLIHNAIKFSHKNGQIILQCSMTSNEAIIRIEDQGIGMSEEARESILSKSDFDSRFGTNNEKGSGLGLVLCKEFIRQNNGKFWVTSEENKGSAFSFSLPLSK